MAQQQPTQQNPRAAGARIFPTRHALPGEVRERVVRVLNQTLADTADLYSQTKHAHWNVKGMSFYQLHQLFDELAETVEKDVDLVAERITALGGFAEGTVRMVARSSRLPELDANVTDEWRIVEALIDRYAESARNVGQALQEAQAVNDMGTADVLTDVVRDLDQGLYFLEAHMQATNRP